MRMLFRMVVLCLLSSTALSHTGTLVGHVTDRKTGERMVGVNVFVEVLSRGVSSAENGYFMIGGLPTGTYSVSASVVGYVKKTLTVAIADDSTVVEFLLDSDILNFDEVTVTSERNFSAASSTILRSIDFELRPRHSAQDMLRLIPGLVIAQHAGGGKAEQMFLRGFDVDHGTDVALSVDGVPVNMVSHGHGQGYADLHFIIPEIVKGIEVYKGPYFAQFGDMATAGAAQFQTRDALESNLFSLEGGSFGTYRYLTMLRIPLQSHRSTSYAAAEFYHTDGYFDSRIGFNRYNVFAKFRSQVSEKGILDIWVSGFGSGWNATGQIPERAVEEGLIGRFGSIDPSEGGTTQRQNLSLSYLGSFANSSTLLTQLYFSRYRFRLYSNFTFYKDDPVNGDGIEQDDDRNIVGLRTEYTISHSIGSITANMTLGTAFRSDEIDVELWHHAQRARLENRVSTFIHQKSMSLYLQEELRLSELIRVQFGLRGDYFVFDVEDKQKNTTAPDISAYAQQTILSPKVNLVVSPSRDVDLFASVGGGFHSNDARVVVTSSAEQTLPRAWGGELGLRVTPFSRFTFSIAAWGIDLQSEFVYVGDEGTTEASGPTRRIGLDFETRVQLLDWLFADGDMNISRGRFKNEPDGENFIPLAPTLTLTGGVTARFPQGYEGSIRVRHIGNRPANEDNSIRAKGSTIVDATVAYRIGNYRLQFTAENLFDVRWNEAQFDTESRLLNEPDAVSELHFTPGTPLSVRARVEYAF